MKSAGTDSKATTPTNRLDLATSKSTYRFIDKDPALEDLISHINASGLTPEEIEAETDRIHRKVSRACIIGWLYRGTKRPQNYTMESVYLALGIETRRVRVSPMPVSKKKAAADAKVADAVKPTEAPAKPTNNVVPLVSPEPV